MATQAEMIARAAAYPLLNVTLGEVRQNDREYWIVTGQIQYQDRLEDVQFQEIKT